MTRWTLGCDPIYGLIMDPHAETAVGTSAEPMSVQHAPGDVVGRYELVRRLGEGGMGEVWEARHREIEKRVAIKFLFPRLAADPAFVERFRREAMATANLDHINICRALDFSSDDDETFLVLDFVDGTPLSDVLENRPKLPVENVVEIAKAICSGLQAAHDIGIIHRDLKPENVMISNGDYVSLKILDFGISASYGEEQDRRLTHTGQAIGTPTYMSPEQIAAKGMGPESDQYGLGVLMFEMLAGRPPYEFAVAFEILEAHVRADIPMIRESRPDVPPELERLISKLMAKAKEERFKSLSEVRSTLSQIDLSNSSPPLPKPRSKAVIGAVSVVAILLLVISGVVIGTKLFKSETALEIKEKISAKVERPDRNFFETRSETISDEAAGAEKAFASGDLDAALVEVEKIENPSLHVISLRADILSQNGEIEEALDLFAQVAKQEPRYLSYAPLIETFTSCMNAKGCKSLDDRGWDLGHEHASDFRQQLYEAAIGEEPVYVKRLAGRVLTKFGGREKLTSRQKDSIIVVNGKQCGPRVEAINRLATEMTEETERIFKTLSSRPTRGCGFLKLKDCIACLRSPLREALEDD